MIIVRNTFAARPGKAGALVAQLKEMAVSAGLKNPRFLTDVSGDYNTVVMEHEVSSLAEFEAGYESYMNDPAVKATAAGYTDHWTSGKREFFKVA